MSRDGDYVVSLRAKSVTALREMRRDTRIGLGFMMPGSAMRIPAEELLRAIEAELERRQAHTQS
jgi:hypothetical protein